MQKLLLVVVVTSLILSLAACSGQPVPQLTAAEQAQVRAYSEPEVDNLMSGIKNDDYTMFSKDFDAFMQTAMSLTSFLNLLDKINNRLGVCTSRSITQMVQKNNLIVVDYDLTCAKEKSVKLEVSFHPDQPHLIGGVGFLNPGLQ